MRLGFGVAAYLEPDVLLVDEVLAVGDATFQQRCLERMRYVLNQGTTLVFVSHDLPAIEATCTNAMWLDEGWSRPLDERATSSARIGDRSRRSPSSSGPAIHSVSAVPRLERRAGGRRADGLSTGREPRPRERRRLPAYLYLGVSEGAATPIFLLNPGREVALEPGGNRISCTVPSLPLPRGRYFLWGAAYRNSPDGQELWRGSRSPASRCSGRSSTQARGRSCASRPSTSTRNGRSTPSVTADASTRTAPIA